MSGQQQQHGAPPSPGGYYVSDSPSGPSPNNGSGKNSTKSPPWAWITAAALAVTTLIFATLYFTRDTGPNNNANPAASAPGQNNGGTSKGSGAAGQSAIPTGDRISSGTYQFPSEFPPGLYRVGTLWYTRNAAGDGIAHEWNLDGPAMMVLPEDAPQIDTVEVQGGAWLLDKSKPLNPFAYNDGTYLVGVDIQPGKYRLTGIKQSTNMAYAARLDDRLEIIDSEVKSDISLNTGTDSGTAVDPNAVHTVTMEVLPTDFAFKFTGRLEKLD